MDRGSMGPLALTYCLGRPSEVVGQVGAVSKLGAAVVLLKSGFIDGCLAAVFIFCGGCWSWVSSLGSSMGRALKRFLVGMACGMCGFCLGGPPGAGWKMASSWSLLVVWLAFLVHCL